MKKNFQTTQAIVILLVVSSLALGYKKMNCNNSHKVFNVINHEVTFSNSKDGITLSGTLSVPDINKKPKIVVLVAGMGPADRDCTVMGRKLFVPIADYFTQQGIAVLRYDKRGVGQSQGTFDMTVTSADLAGDVMAAVQFLKNRDDIDRQNIGLAGMSEGGLIGFMVASQSLDVAFVVSMAGAVATTIDDVLFQSAAQLQADGANHDFLQFDAIIRKQILQAVTTLSADQVKAQVLPLVQSYVATMTDEQKALAATLPFAITQDNYQQIIEMFNSPWYRYYLGVDALSILSNVTVPVLAINGTLDCITDARLTLPIIEQGLKIAGNYDGTFIAIANQNHWFQACLTGALAEYSSISETMHDSTLQLITDWIIKK